MGNHRMSSAQRTLRSGRLERTSRLPAAAAAASWLLVSLPGSALASENLELVPQIPLLVPLVLGFFALIYPVNALIFRPIFHALDERATRIAGARQRAEHIAAEADHVLGRYESAIREARASAEAARKETVASARSEQASIAATARADAEVLVDKARTELAGALGQARSTLRNASQDLGRLAAERILGRPL